MPDAFLSFSNSAPKAKLKTFFASSDVEVHDDKEAPKDQN
jgi:hypothetical protein